MPFRPFSHVKYENDCFTSGYTYKVVVEFRQVKADERRRTTTERRRTMTNDDKRRQRRTMATRSVPRSPDNSCRASARVIDPAAAVNRGRYVHCEV